MVEDFDTFFNEPSPMPDSEGRYLCACKECKKLGPGSRCCNTIDVPGDVCDVCISDCYNGQRDITE